jgi:hypothetical protein
MADTFVKIATVTVGSGGSATIAFSSIPSTYTDLCVKLSVRTNRAASAFDVIYLTLNGSSSNQSHKYLEGNGSSASSGSNPNLFIGVATATNATTSTFSNMEFYIPNYAGSTNKSISADSAYETNATLAYADLTALLWSDSSAINSISLGNLTSSSFVQYSTATLYGISKT